VAYVTLKICGLEYRVVYATSDEVPELAGKEGLTVCSTNTIYVRSNLPTCRARDALVHEVMHAFFEASGIGSFLSDRVRGDYDKFEETLMRLVVQPVLRLVEENGRALIEVPAAKQEPARTHGKNRGKKGKR
jgi:hypothetical protein